MRSTAAILLALTGLSAVAITTVQHGCGAEPCTPDRDSRKPRATVECPTGSLCYLGECVPACNAGAERFTMCTSDSDCSDSVRDRCVNGYCSACPADRTCVPALNLCRPLIETTPDGGLYDAGRPAARTPLDGGGIDGSVFVNDGGPEEETPNQVPPSHVGQIDIAEIIRQGRRSSTISVYVYDVRNSGYTRSATVNVELNPQRCEVLTNEVFTGARQASIGDIRIEGVDTRGLNGTYTAAFANGGYEVTPRVLLPLLVFSSTTPRSTLSYVDVFSSGQQGVTTGSWPPEPRDSRHVPYELKPGTATLNMLSAGITVQRPPMDRLIFTWARPSGDTTFTGDQLVVRVKGPTHELRCEADEFPGKIEVTPTILQAFIDRNGGIPAGTTLDLVFERAFSTRVQVPTDVAGARVRVALSLRIRHSYVTPIRF